MGMAAKKQTKPANKSSSKNKAPARGSGRKAGGPAAKEDTGAASPTPVEILAPAEVDVAQFEAAYQRTEGQARALKDPEQPNVDAQVAALVALRVARTVSAPKLRERFRNLAKSGEYDDSRVEALSELAMATWYARFRVLHTVPAGSTPPQELANEGYKLRSGMLRVLEYNLDHDAKVMKQVTILRAGTGYLDLANDLAALSELYREHAAALSDDKRRYRAEDGTRASQLASSLLVYVGGAAPTPESGWSDMQARCWTLMSAAYREVCRGGLFLIPGPEGEALFPSIIAATRDITVSSTPSPRPAPPAPPAPSP